MGRLGDDLAPLPACDAVQAVRTQGVPLWHARMLEVTQRVTQPEALHDSTRTQVPQGRERHYFGEADPIERHLQDSATSLRREATAPASLGQAPTNFYARRERKHSARNGESDEADELAGLERLYRPVAPALRSELRLPQFNARIARLARQEGWKELHDGRISVHRGKRLAIRFAPLA